MKKLTAIVMTAIIVMTLMVGQFASAEGAWTDKTVTIVVPAKAGGLNDTIARLMQEYLQSKLGMTVVVTNYDTKAVAYETLRNAPADGSYIMLQHSSLFAEAAGGNVEYDPTEELTVVGEIASLGSSAYIAPVDAPYDNFTELLEYARENPNKVTAAYSAKGMSHFQWGAIEQSAGIKLRLVDASNEAEKLTNVAGGFIGLAGVTYGSAKDYVEAGKVKVLAVVNAPEIAEEKGYEQMEELGYTTMAINFMYMWAPGGMAEETAEAIAQAMQSMTEDADFQANMTRAGFPAMTVTLEDATANAKAEMESAYELAEVLGL